MDSRHENTLVSGHSMYRPRGTYGGSQSSSGHGHHDQLAVQRNEMENPETDVLYHLRLNHTFNTYMNRLSNLAHTTNLDLQYSEGTSSRLDTSSQTIYEDPLEQELSQIPQLPPLHEFSIDGILEAIQPEIQGTLDAIAEILGRSRYSLANEYGAHMPPQGEIREAGRILGEQNLLPVEEASASNERLASDPVIIVGEDRSLIDGSLIDGSHAGSVAYDLLERIRAANAARQERSRRNEFRSESVEGHQQQQQQQLLRIPSPSLPDSFQQISSEISPIRRSTTNHLALLQGAGNGQPILNSPSAAPISSPVNVLEGARNLPIHEFGHTDLIVDSPQTQLHSLTMIRDIHSLLSWLSHTAEPVNATATSNSGAERASDRLRGILDRHGHITATCLNSNDQDERDSPSHEINDMYVDN